MTLHFDLALTHIQQIELGCLTSETHLFRWRLTPVLIFTGAEGL